MVRLEGARVFADSVPFDLELRGGEVLGLTGLIGAGKSELLGALFGLRPLAGGTILLDGEALAPANPAEAIGRGVHLVPEDRAGQSLIPLWSVRANATLAVLQALRPPRPDAGARRAARHRGDDRAPRRGLQRAGGADRVAVGRQPAEGRARALAVQAGAGAAARRALPRGRPRRAAGHRRPAARARGRRGGRGRQRRRRRGARGGRPHRGARRGQRRAGRARRTPPTAGSSRSP